MVFLEIVRTWLEVNIMILSFTLKWFREKHKDSHEATQ